GLWTARTPKTCLLLPDAVLRVFRETNTIFGNTRPVLNAAGHRVQCRSGRRSRLASVRAGTRLLTTACGGGRCTLTSCFMRLSMVFSPLCRGKLKESLPAELGGFWP